MLIRTTFSPLPSAPRNVRTLRNDTLFPRKDTAGRVEIVCKASCSRRRRRFLFFRSFTFSLLCYPFRPSTLVIYRGYAADARGEICTTRDRKKKKNERTRAKREERREGIENPQYYRFALIIRSLHLGYFANRTV